MRRVLVSSRTFGDIVRAGEDILTQGGFCINFIGKEERPIDEMKMELIVSRENPDVIISGAEPITKDVLKASDRLRMIMKHGAGVDNIDIEAATARNILVANAPGTNTDAVADLTIAVILALLRGVCQTSHLTKIGGWDRYIGNELGQMTLGIIGTGKIGAGVIKRLQGFEPEILAFDIVRNQDLESKYQFKYVTLEELLTNSDIVTLHVPLTEKTRNMIGIHELKLMKKSAYIVNIARGELIDEAALHDYLKENHIAGAALDVFSTESPQNSPLLKLQNVLATPHIGAYTYEAMERMDRTCGEVIIDTFRGNLTSNILNPEVFDSVTHNNA